MAMPRPSVHSVAGRQWRGIAEFGQLLESARKLSESMDVPGVLTEIVEAAAGLVAAESGELGPRASIVGHEDGMISPLFEHDGINRLEGQWFPIASHPAASRARATGRAATCAGAELQPPFDEIGRRDSWESMACAPIIVSDELYGFLFAVTRRPHRFDKPELEILEGMANLAGLAVANAQRTRELTQLELAKSNFLRLASHELRNPLTALRGYLSMLGEGALPIGQIGDIVPLLTRRVEEINDLVDEMVDFARLEDARFQINPHPCEVAELLGQVVERVRPEAGSTHLFRVVSEGTEPIQAMADPERLRTILLNLLGNAVKYSPEGGEVVCRIRAEGPLAVIEVHDRGLGMTPETMANLFGRFARSPDAEQTLIPGLGLGLYLSRELARLHGGDITAQSVLGEGSSFRLTLPLA